MITKIDILPYIGENVVDALPRIEEQYSNFDVQIVPYGMMITLEYDVNRVNVWVDVNNKISDITQG